jgi:aspartyl-tRNA(Asn)/glutamyl-tRNA(Gln) amidotransferase subunit C
MPEFDMAEVTKDDIRHVCRLARLDLSDQEMDRVGAELNRIMGHFQELQDLDTEGVPITSHAIPMNDVYRDDSNSPSLSVEEVVGNAPDAVEGFFRTSLFMETEE